MPAAGSTIFAFVTLWTSTWRRTRRSESRAPVLLLDGQVDGAPLDALELVGGLVEAHALDRDAVDLDDRVAGLEARLPRRPAADHADEPQPLLVVLELDAQSDEIAVDHGVQVFELVGREVAGEVVERVAGAAGEFEQDGRRPQPDGLASHLAASHGHADRGGAVGDGEVRAVPAEDVAEPGDPLGLGGRRVGLEEHRVPQGDLEIVEAVADQGLEGHGIHVIRLDALDHLVVELGRLGVGQGEQDVAEAGVRVAPLQLEMDLAEPQPTAELHAAGPSLERLAVDLDGAGPVPHPLLVESALQHGAGLAGGGRGGVGLAATGDPGRRGGAGAAGPSARPAVPADQARNIIARAYHDSRRMDDDLPLGSVGRNLVVASADTPRPAIAARSGRGRRDPVEGARRPS